MAGVGPPKAFAKSRLELQTVNAGERFDATFRFDQSQCLFNRSRSAAVALPSQALRSHCAYFPSTTLTPILSARTTRSASCGRLPRFLKARYFIYISSYGLVLDSPGLFDICRLALAPQGER